MFLATAGRTAAIVLSGTILSLATLALPGEGASSPRPLLVADEEPGYLGVTLEETDGLVITEVHPGTPAEQYGLEAGDRILKCAGVSVESLAGLLGVLSDHPAGSRITLITLRGDEKQKVKLVLASREKPRLEKVVEEIVVEETDRRVADHEGALRAVLEEIGGKDRGADHESGFLGITLQGESEARVGEVLSGTAAERAGLRPGDRIVRVDKREIEGRADLLESLSSRSPGTRLLLVVERSGELQKIKAKLGRRDGEAELHEHPGESEPHAHGDVATSDREQALRGILESLEGKKKAEKRRVSVRRVVSGEPGFLGVTLEEGDGLRVVEVLPGTAAERAKLRSGDRIRALDDHEIEGLADLQKALAARPAGEGVLLVLERDGEWIKAKAVLGSRDGDEPVRVPDVARKPLRVRKVVKVAPQAERPGFLGVYLGGEEGAVVAGVIPGTAAEKAGLQEGDRILAVNGRETAGGDAATRAIAAIGAGNPVELEIDRGDRNLRLKFKLGARDEETEGGVPHLLELEGLRGMTAPTLEVEAFSLRPAAAPHPDLGELRSSLNGLRRELKGLRAELGALRAELRELHAIR
jgi:S1-C subfamily serine protease